MNATTFLADYADALRRARRQSKREYPDHAVTVYAVRREDRPVTYRIAVETPRPAYESGGKVVTPLCVFRAGRMRKVKGEGDE